LAGVIFLLYLYAQGELHYAEGSLLRTKGGGDLWKFEPKKRLSFADIDKNIASPE